MDGAVRDFVFGGQRIGLASVSRATEVFPRYVFRLALGVLRVDAPLTPDGIWLVHMTMPDGERMTVLSQDFDRIRAVAERFAPQPRAFPSEPDSDVLGRIAASLRAVFSDRSSF